MTIKKSSCLLLNASLVLLIAACGGKDEAGKPTEVVPSDNVPAGPCSAQRSLCASIAVPETYASKPTKLLAALYDRLPPAGPPRAVLATVEMPEIAKGSPYALEVKDIAVQGEYFLYVAVYSEGGGPFVPVPGIDYVVQSENKLKFNGAPINLGTMTLHIEATP